MAKNRANLNEGGDIVKDARGDLNEMLEDLGYPESGDVSAVTTTGLANKLMKWGATAKAFLHEILIKKTATNALDVQNDGETSVFKVDTENFQIFKNADSQAMTATTPIVIGKSGSGDEIIEVYAYGYKGPGNNYAIKYILCKAGGALRTTTIVAEGVNGTAPNLTFTISAGASGEISVSSDVDIASAKFSVTSQAS